MKISVVGAGSWGTAFASLLAKKGLEVNLWARNPEVARAISQEHRNPYYLSDIRLPVGIKATSIIEDLFPSELLVLAVPSHALRGLVKSLSPFIDSQTNVLSLAKGIEEGTGMRMSEVIAEAASLPIERIAVLSGPNHAEEVIREVPSATVIASVSTELSQKLQEIVFAPYFRVYTNTDLVGVEIGGAAKNVIAIAAGISDGLGFGDNTKASLLTRGLAEIVRLGVALGAKPLTFLGLAGVGDLIATATSKHSRNRFVGEQIGKGKSLEDVLSKMRMVAEGVKTTVSLKKLGEKLNLALPITEEVYQVLYQGKDPRLSVEDLMLRMPTEEAKFDL